MSVCIGIVKSADGLIFIILPVCPSRQASISALPKIRRKMLTPATESNRLRAISNARNFCARFFRNSSLCHHAFLSFSVVSNWFITLETTLSASVFASSSTDISPVASSVAVSVVSLVVFLVSCFII